MTAKLLLNTAALLLSGLGSLSALAATPTHPAANAAAQPAAAADPRAGLPESYKGPVAAVAAVVNDKVITDYDVAQRLRLLIISSGSTNVPPQVIPQLQQRALRDLIEEKLKLADGDKWKVDVSDDEISEEIGGLAGQNGLQPQQFLNALAQSGVDPEGLREQTKARIIWERIISGRFRSRVKVSDREIDDQMSQLRSDATKQQFLVSEICIPVQDPAQARRYYEGGLQLIEQMRKGVPFAAVAQQFSACSTAASGGDIGWVHAGELPKDLDDAVRALPIGSVTNPIPSDGSFVILAVRDKRDAVVAGQRTYTFAYAGAPLSEGRNTALLAIEKLKTADACGSGRSRRQDIGQNAGVAVMEQVKAGDLDPKFAAAIAGLKRGEMTGPVELGGALHVALVCEIDEGLGLPSRAAIEDRITGRELQRISEQYLRDLERTSHVDVRLREQAPLGATPSAEADPALPPQG